MFILPFYRMKMKLGSIYEVEASSSDILISDFPGSRTMSNKLILLINYEVFGWSGPHWLRQEATLGWQWEVCDSRHIGGRKIGRSELMTEISWRQNQKYPWLIWSGDRKRNWENKDDLKLGMSCISCYSGTICWLEETSGRKEGRNFGM